MTTKPKQEIERLREKLELYSDDKNNYLTLLDRLFFDLEYILKDRSDEQIKELRETANYMIDSLLELLDQDMISEALEIYSKEDLGVTLDFYGKYQVSDEKFNEIIDEFSWFDRDDELLILTGAITEFRDSLNNIYFGDLKDFELIAALALNKFDELIKLLDLKDRARYTNKEKLDVWLFICENEAKTKKISIEICLIVKEANEIRIKHNVMFDNSEFERKIHQEALSLRGKNGAKKRHEKTQKIKLAVLAEYDQMYLQALTENKKPKSKDEFSRQMAEKYKGEVKLDTIRKKWLQGYEPNQP